VSIRVFQVGKRGKGEETGLKNNFFQEKGPLLIPARWRCPFRPAHHLAGTGNGHRLTHSSVGEEELQEEREESL